MTWSPPLIPALKTIYYPPHDRQELAKRGENEMTMIWCEVVSLNEQIQTLARMKKHKWWELFNKLQNCLYTNTSTLAQYQYSYQYLVDLFRKIVIESVL